MLIAKFPYIMELIVDFAGAAVAIKAAVAPSAFIYRGTSFLSFKPYWIN